MTTTCDPIPVHLTAYDRSELLISCDALLKFESTQSSTYEHILLTLSHPTSSHPPLYTVNLSTCPLTPSRPAPTSLLFQISLLSLTLTCPAPTASLILSLIFLAQSACEDP
mmetsp:Transcript_40835/g.46833  ORF Transcript_40835/g.46833 Transcript_40835/m.46833 type:complete len:111 (+) Transcript_40835:535-867(+)